VIRNIIFDWSGTLVDDLPAVWQATNYVFDRAGVASISMERFRDEFCLPFKGFYDRYVSHVPMAQLEEWFHRRFREVQDEVEELRHARPFLERCRERGIRTFVLSAVHQDHFATQTERIGFTGFIDRPYTGVVDKRARILELLVENDLPPRETLLVGDMEHDIETARQGGVFSCAVLTGYTGLKQLRAASPDLIVEHLGELNEFLERARWDFTSANSARCDRQNSLPIPTVGALIFNQAGQALMIRTHKWSNLWGIPGGKIKGGESSEAALRREIREETKLDIDEVEFVLAQDCVFSPEFYRDAHFVLLNYVCQTAHGSAVQLNGEAQEFRWLSLEEAQTLPLNTPTRILIEAVRSRRSSQADGQR